MCETISPAGFSRSLVQREAFDKSSGSGAGVLGARETVCTGRRAANFDLAEGGVRYTAPTRVSFQSEVRVSYCPRQQACDLSSNRLSGCPGT